MILNCSLMLYHVHLFIFSCFFYLDIPDPTIIITPTGSGNISDNYTLMCSVDTVDDLLNIQINITFLRITDGSYQVLSNEESSGDAIIYVHFTPLMTSDSGRYRCSVDITQSSIDYQDVFYESFTINTTSEYDICVGTKRIQGAPAPSPLKDDTNINLIPLIPVTFVLCNIVSCSHSVIY